MFKNRSDAGKKLVEKLNELLAKGKPLKTVVVALPRGGVPVAVEIAKKLSYPITILVSKKIPAPFQPEFAVGAVSSSGVVVRNDDCGFDSEFLAKYIESQRERIRIQSQQSEFKWLAAVGIGKQIDFSNARVILVDDGVATGMTMLAAAKSVRLLGASETIVATPVLAHESRDLFQNQCDEIVAVKEPMEMGAVGLFYEDFEQLSDEEVHRTLAACSEDR